MRKKGDTASTIFIDKELVDRESEMFLISARISFKNDDADKNCESIYCHLQHDLGIDWLLRDLSSTNRSFKKLEIKKIRKVGDSLAKKQPIKKWVSWQS